MRVGVYDAHWSSMGGGEKLAATYAQAFQHRGAVDLVVHAPVDIELINARLDLSLTNVAIRVVDEDVDAVTAASADYDLFINASFLGSIPSAANRSIFVVHFPEPPLREFDRTVPLVYDHLAEWVLGARLPRINFVGGFHPLEHEDGRAYRWTNGHGRIEVDPHGDRDAAVAIVVTGQHRDPATSPRIDVAVNGEIHRKELRPDAPTVLSFELRSGHSHLIELVSDTFTVAGDPRVFGVQVIDDARQRAIDRVRGVVEAYNHVRHMGRWLDTYDVVVSNSAFTQRWVQEYWCRESEVVYPAIRFRGSDQKRPVILSVGRFSAHEGHSKKQRELVQAFRALVERGAAAGWELWLIGSTGDVDYVEQVRRAAEGLPVRVIVNAPGELVSHAYAVASLYWHGMGLGENPDRHPVRFEHFGISIVEAMSAGAVPLVVAGGGQAETVEDGVSGLLFDSVDDLAAQTALLIRRPDIREAFAARASRRSRDFGLVQFEQRVLELAGVNRRS